LIFSCVILLSSCERRQQIINEGNFTAEDSTVYHWKEYMFNDSFFREVTSQGKRMTFTIAQTQQKFRDSTFAETDYYANGNRKATRNFIEGRQEGVWQSWYEDGRSKSSSVVSNGVLRDYFSYYDSGSIAVTASRAEDGTMSRAERWRNGNLKEEFLTDSLGNGTCTNYHENGRRSQEGKLYRFAPAGEWQRWDSLGAPMSDTTYGLPVEY
jgi:antitoxin component YwqK of YwqJK toxin-antitoxin module